MQDPLIVRTSGCWEGFGMPRAQLGMEGPPGWGCVEGEDGGGLCFHPTPPSPGCREPFPGLPCTAARGGRILPCSVRPPPFRGRGAVGACSEVGGGGGARRGFVCTDLRQLSPGGGRRGCAVWRAWPASRRRALLLAAAGSGETCGAAGGGVTPSCSVRPPQPPIPVPPLRASEPTPTRSRLRSPHISSMHGGETRPPPLPQPPPITFRPCAKHPCTSWTPIPSHSHGLSSAGAALLCSACSSTGAAPVPPLPTVLPPSESLFSRQLCRVDQHH